MRNKIFSRVLKIAAIISLIISTVACVGIETDISFEDNNSGTIELVYTVDRLIENLGSLEDKATLMPFPVEETDFVRTVNAIEGLSLESFQRSRDSLKTTITARLAFESLEALNQFYSPDIESITVIDLGDGTSVMNFSVYTANQEAPDEETTGYLREFFSEYQISIKVTAPSTITSGSNSLVISENTGAYSVALSDLIIANEDVVLTLNW